MTNIASDLVRAERDLADLNNHLRLRTARIGEVLEAIKWEQKRLRHSCDGAIARFQQLADEYRQCVMDGSVERTPQADAAAQHARQIEVIDELAEAESRGGRDARR